jgi:hypothetical protein
MMWRGREGTGTERGRRLDSGRCRSERIPPGMRDRGSLRSFCRTGCRHYWRSYSTVFCLILQMKKHMQMLLETVLGRPHSVTLDWTESGWNTMG